MHSGLLPQTVSMVMTLYMRSLSWSNEGWTYHVKLQLQYSRYSSIYALTRSSNSLQTCAHWWHFTEKAHGLIMSVLHTGTFIHVANMEQKLIPKQPTTCVCEAFIYMEYGCLGHNTLLKWMEDSLLNIWMKRYILKGLSRCLLNSYIHGLISSK